MYQYVIEIPQVDVGKVSGQDPLNLAINALALLLIERASSFCEQAVQFGIGIVAAVGPFGSEAGGIECVFENIRVLVGIADPAQRVDLEGAFPDIRVEGRELKATNVERNAHAAQLLLKDCGEQAS